MMDNTKPSPDLKIDSKNVCADMLQRLQSQITTGLEFPKYGAPVQAGLTSEQKLADLELKLKDLQRSLGVESAPEPKKKLSDREAADQIAEKLKTLVDEFNAKLKEWRDTTGCVANFGWNYSDGKSLEVTGIDYIVYRKEPPSAKTLKDALSGSIAETK
jgi:hypothetical protein